MRPGLSSALALALGGRYKEFLPHAQSVLEGLVKMGFYNIFAVCQVRNLPARSRERRKGTEERHRKYGGVVERARRDGTLDYQDCF